MARISPLFDGWGVIYYDGSSAHDESEGYEAPDPDFSTNFIMMLAGHMNLGEFIYRGLFQYRAATLTNVEIIVAGNRVTSSIIKNLPSPTLNLNDFNVTIDSAQHPRFTPLGRTYTYNHTMMDNSVVGLSVLQAIQGQQLFYK